MGDATLGSGYLGLYSNSLAVCPRVSDKGALSIQEHYHVNERSHISLDKVQQWVEMLVPGIDFCAPGEVH